MHEQLRNVGRRLAPMWAADRARRYERASRERAGVPRLAVQVVERIGDTVIDGPCAGLRYPADRLADVDSPVAKLVGAYERQLHEPLRIALAAGRRPFVDVGCADGYYAVGLAAQRPWLDVVAYDHSRSARELCGALAALNGCADRVDVRRHCDARELRRLELDGALVLVDIEGGEFELLDDEAATLLGGAMVLVELHRPLDDPACVALRERFAGTHEVDAFTGIVVDPAEVSALAFLPADERAAATSEWRVQSEQWWLVLTPR